MEAVDLKGMLERVRPITKGEGGLAALVFSTRGRLYSFFRNVMLSCPVPEDFPEFCCNGDLLVKAATTTSKLSVSDTRLTLVSGKIRTWLPLDKESMLPEPVPGAEFVQVPEGLIKMLVELAKLVPEEAPQVWATSLLLKGAYAYATNGAYIVRQKLDIQLPFSCAFPKALVTVLAKLKKPLGTMSFDGHQIYITFTDGSRLSSPVYGSEWPDVSSFFEALDMEPVHPELIEFLQQVKPFCDDDPKVTFEIPNTASFWAGEAMAEAKFDSEWIKSSFATSLKYLSAFTDKSAEIAFTKRFAMIKYEKRTIILAAKG